MIKSLQGKEEKNKRIFLSKGMNVAYTKVRDTWMF